MDPDEEAAEAARLAEEQLDEFAMKLDEEAERLAERRAARREAKRARTEERADAQFRAELEAAALRERESALTEEQRLAAALELVENADPQQLMRLRCARAVRGVPFLEQRATQPSLGGLTEGQMEEVGRKEAAAEMGWQNEQRAREHWIASQEETIRNLTSGQSPDNQRQIRAQFHAQKAGS